MGKNKKNHRNNHQKEHKQTNKHENKEIKKEEKIIEKKEKKADKKDKKSKKKHPKLRLFLKIFFITMLMLMIAGIAAVVAIFKTDKWAITEDELLSDSGAIIYDKYNNEIARLTGDEINKKVTLAEMGKVPEAFVAIEDERFYDHKGIDIKRSLYAIVKYVISRGNASFGGSTITQQLVKITMKDDARSGLAGIERKIREWSRAVQVEKMLEKDQILERYLNRIYLGSSGGLEVRGVEAASRFYFNKPAKELSIAQSAFIAGINHSPNNYYPFGENDISEKVKTRTLNVLGKMHELGKLNDEEYNGAVEETKNGLAFAKGNISNGKNELSYHTAAAINQIALQMSEEKDISYSAAREILVNSGYKIYTTVDQSIQDKMEAVFEDPKYIMKGSSPTGYKPDGQSAMVIVEASTGHVVGEVGALGKDQDTLGINRGTSTRQPGSSFKPLVTIAPGLENKIINASTLFYDTLTSFGTYRPHNDSERYSGIVSIRDAIKYSRNVVEVKLLSIMGLGKSQEFLSSIGINIDANNAGLSMALGSVSVSPLQMAAAYAAIANKGVYITPTFYTNVVDKNGVPVLSFKEEKRRVMSEENAYIESSILKGPINGGTAGRYSGVLGSMDVGGKTGTSDGGVDRWFCGFTPYYAGACWYGADDGYNYDGKGHRVAYYLVGGDNPAARIWFPVMKSVHEGLEVKKFEKPSNVVSAKICKVSGKRATDKCTDTYSEIFAKDNMPEECDGHQTVKICKETGKLATEFCTDTEEKTFGTIIDTEKNATWSPKQEAETAPEETCNVHTEAEKVKVPNVVGEDEKTATTLLKNAGFKVKVLKDNDKNKAKGIVLKQNVKEAPKGSEITITVNQYNGSSSGNTTTNTISNSTTNRPGNTTGSQNQTTSQNQVAGNNT